MSVFIAKLDNIEEVRKFYEEMSIRKEQDLLSNFAKIKEDESSIYWVNIINIKMPPIYFLTIIFIFLWLFIGGWFWFIPMGFFALSYIVFWKSFHIWIFKKGLKKAGYTGTVSILSNERGLMEVLEL